MAAMEQRREIDALSHIERTHALRTAELVAADGIEIDAEVTDIDWKPSTGLNAIAVKRHTCHAS